ncbi:cation:proton antiporter [Bdellovibrio sp. SKB1291214]|uniref:cation:proton antiporter domain-containing protein n=1 Tax=Bdellovibrio sp. SKB1291214 TaxID=1732569 RepID=UPI000B51C3E1|nr:cation:proton antiporter [Bdellovibrio sp. SKB1291214]UYL07780.1 cation:proton antiporter [Bdellovibrio sp. SKB1291214]
MHSLPALISDLALILGTAGIVTLLFKRLNQPVVLGYLVAGFLIGPNVGLFGTVSSSEGVQLWADIGVIFLLFALGLEFSFKKLFRVGGSASFTALFEVGFMTIIGFTTGKLLGWDLMDCLFLGGILGISSTSIAMRTIDEMGLKNKKFVSIVMGVLVIEDLVAVMLLVFLTSIALTREFAGSDMLLSFLKLAFYLSLWFVVGIFWLPTALKKMQSMLNEETLLVVAVGLCLAMVVFAVKVGFSAALGAFITGSILAETIEGERIHHLVTPIKTLFSAVFFISVGMLIDPDVIATHWQVIVLLSVLVLIGKTLGVTVGAVLSGQTLKSSLQTGMTLSQIGEFSFIIATVGVGFKVVRPELYPLAVSVSVVTAFTTPFMIRMADGTYKFLEKKMPTDFIQALDRYSMFSFTMAAHKESRDQVRAYVFKIFLNAVIVIGVFLLMAKVTLPYLLNHQVEEGSAKFLTLTATLIMSSPFLWALAFGRTKQFDSLVAGDGRGTQNYVFIISRVMVAVGLVGAMVAQFVPLGWALGITAWMAVVVGYVLSTKLRAIYQWFENRFITNLTEEVHKVTPRTHTQALAPWDAHLTEFKVPAEAQYLGIPLAQLSIRERFGVTVALIERGRRKIMAPGRDVMLMPQDIVFVIGNDDQLANFKGFIDAEQDYQNLDEDLSEYTLEKYILTEQSKFLGKTIRDSGLRESTNGLVVGIEREGERILNPDSGEVLKLSDLLWIVGDRSRIRDLV